MIFIKKSIVIIFTIIVIYFIFFSRKKKKIDHVAYFKFKIFLNNIFYSFYNTNTGSLEAIQQYKNVDNIFYINPINIEQLDINIKDTYKQTYNIYLFLKNHYLNKKEIILFFNIYMLISYEAASSYKELAFLLNDLYNSVKLHLNNLNKSSDKFSKFQNEVIDILTEYENKNVYDLEEKYLPFLKKYLKKNLINK